MDKELGTTVVRLTLAERSFLRWVRERGEYASIDLSKVSDRTSAKVKQMETKGYVTLVPMVGRGPHARTINLTDFGNKVVDVIENHLAEAMTNIVTNEVEGFVEFTINPGEQS